LNENENLMPEDPEEEMSRRGFIRLAAYGVSLAYVGAIGYPVYRYLNSPVERASALAAVNEVTLDKANELVKGSALMFKFGVRPTLLIHHSDDTWTAMDAVCTHMGCTVKFDAQTNQILCACHGGVYNAKTGETVSGPPPRPLATYKVEVNATSVHVMRA
jgi:cytochrome b6-f complex iron-sulfur subunit